MNLKGSTVVIQIVDSGLVGSFLQFQLIDELLSQLGGLYLIKQHVLREDQVAHDLGWGLRLEVDALFGSLLLEWLGVDWRVVSITMLG